MLTLYEHPFALYCQKVLIALDELGVAYDVLRGAARLRPRRAGRAVAAGVDPGAARRRRDDRRDVDHHRVRRRRAAGAVARGPQVGPRLRPVRLRRRPGDRLRHDRAALRRARASPRRTRPARHGLRHARGAVGREHEFLAGDTFTIADCAAAPGLFYALAIHPWDEGTHPQLTRYYRALAQRPSFAKVIADARPYRHLFPLPWPADFDRYH